MQSELAQLLQKATETVNKHYKHSQMWMEPAMFSLKRAISTKTEPLNATTQQQPTAPPNKRGNVVFTVAPDS